MSIVILLGGQSEHGNPEHRYLASRFLEHFDDRVSQIITVKPQKRTFTTRLKRMAKRGNFRERIARALYKGGYGPCADELRKLLLPDETEPKMPSTDKVSIVSSHNSDACRDIIKKHAPQIIVVYGTAIIHEPTFSLASKITLNMHTGLSPYYRGDSTLFWPVHDDNPSQLGVTVHELVQSVDGGDIAATARVHYERGDSEANLFAKGVAAGTDLYIQAVEQAINNELQLQSQDLSLGQEFSWRHRTVAAERKVLKQLDHWAKGGDDK